MKRYLVFWVQENLYRIESGRVERIIRISRVLPLPFKDRYALVFRGKPYISANGHIGKYAVLLKDFRFVSCDSIEGVFDENKVFGNIAPQNIKLDDRFIPLIKFDAEPAEISLEEEEIEEEEKDKYLIFSTDSGYMALDIRDVISVDYELKHNPNTLALTSFPRYSIKVKQDGESYDLWVLGIGDFVGAETIKESKNPMFKKIITVNGKNVGVPNLKFLSNKENIKAILGALKRLVDELELPEIKKAYDSLSKLVNE